MSFTLFVIGNIASGKSTACRYLASRGARHIDLDRLAKDLYVPGSQVVQELAEEFGWDVLDEFGGIRPNILANRAFRDPESTARLNGIVHPVLIERLGSLLIPIQCCSAVVPSFPLTVVEVSAPVSFRKAFTLADEVLAITASVDVRRERALSRDMSLDDFEARASVQPSESELIEMADFAIDNDTAGEDLFDRLDAWVMARGLVGLGDPHAGSGIGNEAVSNG